MPTTTTNYGLVKPTEASEFVDIDVINANMDTIDALIASRLDGPWTQYTPTVYNGHVVGTNSIFFGRYKKIGTKTLLLSITYVIKAGGGLAMPAQLIFGLPAGMSAEASNPLRGQSLVMRYYTNGVATFAGTAVVVSSVGTDRLHCYRGDGGGGLGSATMGVDSSLDIEGVLELA